MFWLYYHVNHGYTARFPPTKVCILTCKVQAPLAVCSKLCKISIILHKWCFKILKIWYINQKNVLKMFPCWQCMILSLKKNLHYLKKFFLECIYTNPFCEFEKTYSCFIFFVVFCFQSDIMLKQLPNLKPLV